MARIDSQSGLTLVEVLVALAIMSAVAAAILSLIGQNTRFIASAETRMVASMAADEVAVEALARRAPLEQGESDQTVSFAGRDWLVRTIVTELEAVDARRIDIEVRSAPEGQVLASLSTLRAAASP